MSIVDRHAIAGLLNLTPARVGQLVKGEGMPQHARGQFDELACAAWYIRYLQQAGARRAASAGVGGDSFRHERTRVARAEAGLKELELAERRGELLDASTAGRVWAQAMEKLRARMIASIGSAAAQCIGLRTIGQANAVLERVVHEALREGSAVAAEVRTNGHAEAGPAATTGL